MGVTFKSVEVEMDLVAGVMVVINLIMRFSGKGGRELSSLILSSRRLTLMKLRPTTFSIILPHSLIFNLMYLFLTKLLPLLRLPIFVTLFILVSSAIWQKSYRFSILPGDKLKYPRIAPKCYVHQNVSSGSPVNAKS